jgi:hypothetical protein
MRSKSNHKRVLCRTPTPGKKPTRIDSWKFDAVRKAILKIVPRKGEGVLFSELADMVAAALGESDCSRLGSVPWYTVTVKLELEVAGELRRIPNAGPQRLLRI